MWRLVVRHQAHKYYTLCNHLYVNIIPQENISRRLHYFTTYSRGEILSIRPVSQCLAYDHVICNHVRVNSCQMNSIMKYSSCVSPFVHADICINPRCVPLFLKGSFAVKNNNAHVIDDVMMFYTVLLPTRSTFSNTSSYAWP